jgi:hypothetical protein
MVYADANEQVLKSLVDQDSSQSGEIKDGAGSISCPAEQ